MTVSLNFPQTPNFPFDVLIELGFLRDFQSPPKGIAECEELAEVVVVVRVMDGVVLGAHEGLRVTPHGIVDIRCPHTRKKQQEYVGEIVHRHQKEENHIWAGLRGIKRTMIRMSTTITPT